jgi:hypothetical protein
LRSKSTGCKSFRIALDPVRRWRWSWCLPAKTVGVDYDPQRATRIADVCTHPMLAAESSSTLTTRKVRKTSSMLADRDMLAGQEFMRAQAVAAFVISHITADIVMKRPKDSRLAHEVHQFVSFADPETPYPAALAALPSKVLFVRESNPGETILSRLRDERCDLLVCRSDAMTGKRGDQLSVAH